MKQLKTIITMLVVFAMLVSSVGVFAAETKATTTFSDVTPGTKVADAVAKLVGYGVINGYEDGTFKPDNTITRAEFAAIITRFKGVEGAANAVTGFQDLDNDSSRAWARPYVKAAIDAGIINGFEDGTFRAAEPVTYEQAVKMIVCAIGYEPVAKSEYNKLQAIGSANLTWSSGYIATASKNGITAGAATANVTEPASRGTVAVLTSNAYEVPKLNQQTDANGNISYEKGEGTYGEDQYNTQEKIVGTVVATYYTGLDEADSDLDVNEIVINDNENGDVTYEMTEALAGKINIEDILGKRVTAYYAKDEHALTSITEDRNSVKTVEESKINRPLKGGSISYIEDGRNSVVNVSGFKFIYNGKAGYISSLDELEPLFTNGYIEVNDTTGVVKITSYDVMVVNSFNRNEGNGKIYLKYETLNGNNYYEFPSGGTSSKPEIFVNGSKKAFDSLSLSAYSVINYMESPNVGGKEIKRMYVTTGAKSGKVTSILDGERLVEINNNELYLTNDYYNYTPGASGDKKAPFEMNDSYTYYLDYTGQIAAINYTAASQGSFEVGYVIGADEKDGLIKLVRKNGEIKTYTLKSKIKFDGQSIDNDEIETALQTVADELLAGGSNQKGYRQPVKFSLSGGEISAIDSVKTVEGGNNDTFGVNELYTGKTVRPNANSVKVGDKSYSLSSTSTVVMYIPDDRSAEAEYAVMTPAKAFSVAGDRQLEIFGADTSGKMMTAALVLVYGINPSLTLTGSSPYMIVTGTPNETTMEGYRSGSKEVTPVTISEDKFYVDAEKAWVSYASVSKGDLVRLLETGGEVVAIEMIYDASEGKDGFNTGCPNVASNGLTFTDTEGTDLYIYYAEAFEKLPDNQENKISVTTEFASDVIDDKYAKSVVVAVNSSTVYYSVDGADIISGDSMDVIVDEIGAESKVIYLRTSSASSAAKFFYVVK